MQRFKGFLSAYPPDSTTTVNAKQVSDQVQSRFGITVPAPLVAFWDQIGSGYFGDREIFFFGGSQSSMPRDSIMNWNQQECWREVFPDLPKDGAPFFFAETIFGDQLGFRYEKNRCKVVLLEIDQLELYLLCDKFSDLFKVILTEPHSLVDVNVLQVLRKKIGQVPEGMHYAPVISPLVGGSDRPSNYHFEERYIHLTTAIATLKALSE